MSDDELRQKVNNEIEWRKLLWKKMEETHSRLEEYIKQDQEFKKEMLVITTTLKVKIGTFGVVFGFIGGATVSIVAALIKA